MEVSGWVIAAGVLGLGAVATFVGTIIGKTTQAALQYKRGTEVQAKLQESDRKTDEKTAKDVEGIRREGARLAASEDPSDVRAFLERNKGP